MASRNESDRKYEEKNPSLKIRIPRDILEQIPQPRPKFIRDAIKEKLNEKETTSYNKKEDKNHENHDQQLTKILVKIFIDHNIVAEIPDHLVALVEQYAQEE